LASSSAIAPFDVDVTFAVQVDQETFVPEPDPADLVLAEAEYRAVPGRLEIRSSKTPPVLPEDELVPLVTNLCFRAVSRLRETRNTVVGYTDHYGYLRMDAEGRWIRLSGDHVPDVRLPARPLVEALVACGGRFIRWLPQLDLRGDVDRIRRRLESEEREAHAALDGGLFR
jgi:hypothetical protein